MRVIELTTKKIIFESSQRRILEIIRKAYQRDIGLVSNKIRERRVTWERTSVQRSKQVGWEVDH